MKRDEVLAHQRPERYVKFAIAFLLQPYLFFLIVSSYPHSMAPCRWFSNRKDCIWKHKPTIYTPNKQWDVSLNTLNSLQSSWGFFMFVAVVFCCCFFSTNTFTASIISLILHGATNTSFGQIASPNWLLSHCLLTKACDGREGQKGWAWI